MSDLTPGGIVAIGSGALAIAAASWTALRLAGPRPFSSFALLVSAGGAGLTLVLPALAFGIVLKPPVVVALVAGGAILGILAGSAPRLARDTSGRVLVRGGSWHALPLGLAVAAMQVTGVLGSLDGVVLSVAALHAATAFVVAAVIALLARRVVVRAPARAAALATPSMLPPTALPSAWMPAGSAPPPRLPAIGPAPAAALAAAPAQVTVPAPAPPQATVAAPAFAPPQATVAAPGGDPGAAPPAGTTRRTVPVRATCGACGAAVAPGWRHCVTCGAALAWEGSGR